MKEFLILGGIVAGLGALIWVVKNGEKKAPLKPNLSDITHDREKLIQPDPYFDNPAKYGAWDTSYTSGR